jgi:hypothetical protein
MKDTEVLLREQLRNLIQGKANAERRYTKNGK